MVSSVVKVLSSLYSTIGGRRCQLRPRGSWLRPGGRAGGLEAGGRRRMRGCPVFIKAGCDRMVKLRAGNSGPYDNPALMRLMLLVTRGSIIYPHGPGWPMQTIRNIVKLSRTFRVLNVFWTYFYFKMLQWPYLIPPRESAAAASDPPVPFWSPHSVFYLHTPS